MILLKDCADHQNHVKEIYRSLPSTPQLVSNSPSRCGPSPSELLLRRGIRTTLLQGTQSHTELVISRIISTTRQEGSTRVYKRGTMTDTIKPVLSWN